MRDGTAVIKCASQRLLVNSCIFLVKTLVVILATSSLAVAQQNQSLLQITSPVDGAVANPGQTISVVVTSAAGIPFTQVAVIGEKPIGFSSVDTSAPFQFSVTIPGGIRLGKFYLVSVATVGTGSEVYSPPITINVEGVDMSTQLVATPPQILFESQGEQIPVHINARFSDGSSPDVTRSSNLSFSSSNNGVAIVDSMGLVTAIGAGTASVTASYTLGAQSIQVAVPVTVPSPTLTLSTNGLVFGSQSVGTISASHALTITNSSSAALKISSIKATGDFASADNCVGAASIPARGSCTANVTFAPTANGARSGTLTIADSLTVAPVSLTLTGTGIGAAISLSPASLSLGIQS